MEFFFLSFFQEEINEQKIQCRQVVRHCGHTVNSCTFFPV
jgi:hypothetical protein